MKKFATIMAAGMLVGVLGAAAPAKAADICVQFDGLSCDLGGDLGFFRFTGAKFPSNNKKSVSLNGRSCAYGSVTGTLVMNHDSSFIHLGATFDCDATVGVITADFAPASTTIGSTATLARASYGSIDLSSSCTATIVDCTTEP